MVMSKNQRPPWQARSMAISHDSDRARCAALDLVAGKFLEQPILDHGAGAAEAFFAG